MVLVFTWVTVGGDLTMPFTIITPTLLRVIMVTTLGMHQVTILITTHPITLTGEDITMAIITDITRDIGMVTTMGIMETITTHTISTVTTIPVITMALVETEEIT
jgi:hypothetical protein